jgi:hypothetical protein
MKNLLTFVLFACPRSGRRASFVVKNIFSNLVAALPRWVGSR